jgi:cysteine-rich repeat protein
MQLNSFGLCECVNNTNTGGSCIPEGCVSYPPVVGAVQCLSCDSSLYEPTPVNDQCQCLYVIGGVCTLVLFDSVCTSRNFSNCVRCTEHFCLTCKTDFALN